MCYSIPPYHHILPTLTKPHNPTCPHQSLNLRPLHFRHHQISIALLTPPPITLTPHISYPPYPPLTPLITIHTELLPHPVPSFSLVQENTLKILNSSEFNLLSANFWVSLPFLYPSFSPFLYLIYPFCTPLLPLFYSLLPFFIPHFPLFSLLIFYISYVLSFI